jgi:hypothetical protein
VARLPLSAETGDISRVERFRWIVLEAAARRAIYWRFLRENRGTNGGLMEFSIFGAPFWCDRPLASPLPAWVRAQIATDFLTSPPLALLPRGTCD